MTFLDLVWLVPVLPLLGAAFNGVLGRRLPKSIIGGIGCGTVGASLIVSLGVFFETLNQPERLPAATNYFAWIQAGAFTASFGFLIDQLSIVMILVVSGVGFLIHVYSIGYMGHDGGFYRYFAYLNLFTFSMLTLVLANNYVLMFLGWEGVGLCSYLLIGFWFFRKSAADAGKKAFVVNRVGDFGFTLGLLLIYWTFGTVDFQAIFGRVQYARSFPIEPLGTAGVLTAICLLLFLGAAGKSAQIPLYVWLPDAMEGPTPVSALIHAATMVTAGVYMVARSGALYDRAPTALVVVAVIGILTAFWAASIALVQNDLKRVLAYSTVSQLGYMFLACGVGAYIAAIFHLFTHAFFKALLFLGSGSVMHALDGEQDMRKMGALKGKTPITFWTMLVATLAIAGMPGLAGFFSKDEILWKAYSNPHGHSLLWLAGVAVAGMTAFYMFRLLFMTFFGESRVDHQVEHHIHESPRSMTIPLILLAVGSLSAGWLGIPAWMGGANTFESFLEPAFKVVPQGAETEQHPYSHTDEAGIAAVGVGIALAGFLLAFRMYCKKSDLAERLAARYRAVYKMLSNKYYVDEIYDAFIVWPIAGTARKFLWMLVDALIIDGAVNGVGKSVRGAATRLRYMQAGYVRAYVGWIFLGGLLVMAWLLR